MPQSTKPLISVGIPVFQEARHLARTLETLIGQTYENLEIVITDNASTDETEDICREFAARDSRIRYIRNRSNLGSARNYNLCFELSRGDFFMWCRGHDDRASDYVERLYEVMRQDPNLVLVHGACSLRGVDGQFLRTIDEALETRGMSLADRLRFVWQNVVGPAVVGLLRSSAMDRTRLFQNTVGFDQVFLFELAIQGAFAFLDEPIVCLQESREETSEDETLRRTYAQMNPLRFPQIDPVRTHTLDLATTYLQIIENLSLPRSERVHLQSEFLDWYGETFKGSIERCSQGLVEGVVNRFEHEISVDFDALQTMNYLNTALLLRPGLEEIGPVHGELMIAMAEALIDSQPQGLTTG